MTASLTPPDCLVILIPGLIPSSDMLTPLFKQVQLPALERLLARASQRDTVPGLTDQLCLAMNLPRTPDWPVAPLCLGASGETFTSGYWLRADPVHLRADRDQLVLIDQLPVSYDEAHILQNAFNSHFAEDGLSLHITEAQDWYLHSQHTLNVKTTPRHEVAGKSVNKHLPGGPDALALHRLFNETQMLFFSLPINQQREARGLPTINSIWCWGGGHLPLTRDKRPAQTIIGEPSDWLDIAQADDWETLPLPDHADQLPTQGWLILDSVYHSAQHGDYAQWITATKQIDEQWLKPVLNQLARGKRHTVILQGSHPHSAQQTRWIIKRHDLWRFWRNAALPQTLRAADNGDNPHHTTQAN